MTTDTRADLGSRANPRRQYQQTDEPLALYQVNDHPWHYRGTTRSSDRTADSALPANTYVLWDGQTHDDTGDVSFLAGQPDDPITGSFRYVNQECLTPVVEPTPFVRVADQRENRRPQGPQQALYRIREGARRLANLNSVHCPEPGTTFYWDGHTVDEDGELTLVIDRPGTVNQYKYVDPQYAELVEHSAFPRVSSEQVGALLPEPEQSITAGQASYLEGLVHQLTDERNAAERASGSIERERDALAAELARMQQERDELAAALLQEAQERGWCGEYEEFVRKHPGVGLKPRVSDYTVTVRALVTFDIPVRNRRSEADAREYAEHMRERVIRSRMRALLEDPDLRENVQVDSHEVTGVRPTGDPVPQPENDDEPMPDEDF